VRAGVGNGASASDPRAERLLTLRLVALLSATFAGAYYSNIALVPLGAVLEHFHTSVALGALVLGGFAVPLAAATPVAAYAAEAIGLTRALALAVGTVALGSVAAALAPSFAVLVAVRVIQGTAAAVIVPAVLILLASTSSARGRPLALGMWSSVNSLGRLVSFPLGGLLAATAGWSAVFWSAVPICGLASLAVAVFVPRRAATRRPLDRGVAASLTCGAALVLGGLSALAADRTGLMIGACLGAAGAGLLVVAWRRSRGTPASLVPVGLLSSPTIVRSSVGGFVQMAMIVVDITAVSLFLVRDGEASSASAGLVALAFSAVMVVASTFAGAAIGGLGGRRVFWIGLALLAAGQGGIALALSPDAGVSALLIVSLGVAGAGAAFVQTSSASGATRPEHRGGTAVVGIVNLVRFSGTAAGAAWLAIAFSFGTSARVLFLSAAVIVGAVLVLSAVLGRRPRAGAPMSLT
jgi:MFS family permease